MKRDGANTSLWQHSTKEFISNGNHSKDVFDVVIVGGGITGITTAFLLQKGGKKCLVAEAQTLCFGTTGGTTAHLNTFLDTDYSKIKKDFGEDGAQLVAKATRQALDLVKQHVQTYKIDCGYTEKDGYLFAQTKPQVQSLDEIFQASELAGVSVEYTNDTPVPIEFEKAIVYHAQAQMHPARYVMALAQEFEKAGGVILQNCRVTHVKDEEPMIVETNGESIRTHKLIYATHIPPHINLLHFRCAPYRSYVMAVTLKDEAYPNGLAYDMYDPYHYYRTEEVDGQKYLIAGGEDHKTAHMENTEESFAHLEAHLHKYFDIDKIAFKWSSQYYEPADGLAYIGKLPGASDNIYVATGYSGNGITYSHIAAITLSQIILKGKSEFEEIFDPTRIKPVAGFTNFVKENADVVAQFIGKRIHHEKLEELAMLAHGEAKVVKYEGDTIAIYKDELGTLHAVSPVCTHAKCVVGWNSTERTWDCPCHGARYNPDGQMVTGPAHKDLEKITLQKHVSTDETN